MWPGLNRNSEHCRKVAGRFPTQNSYSRTLELAGETARNNPLADGLDEFQAYGESAFRNELAISDAGHSAERTAESSDRYLISWFPSPGAQNARAARAYVFGECRFNTGPSRVARNLNAYFHGNARFAARFRRSFWDPHPKSHVRYPLSRDAAISRPPCGRNGISFDPYLSCGTDRGPRRRAVFRSMCRRPEIPLIPR